jgi:hypothetical protein
MFVPWQLTAKVNKPLLASDQAHPRSPRPSGLDCCGIRAFPNRPVVSSCRAFVVVETSRIRQLHNPHGYPWLIEPRVPVGLLVPVTRPERQQLPTGRPRCATAAYQPRLRDVDDGTGDSKNHHSEMAPLPGKATGIQTGGKNQRSHGRAVRTPYTEGQARPGVKLPAIRGAGAPRLRSREVENQLHCHNNYLLS